MGPTAAPTAPSGAESRQSPTTPISDVIDRIFGEPTRPEDVSTIGVGKWGALEGESGSPVG